jgi:hypothetical protein
MSGSAWWMRRRTSASVAPRQPPSDRIRSSMRRAAAFAGGRGAARFDAAVAFAVFFATFVAVFLDFAAGVRVALDDRFAVFFA